MKSEILSVLKGRIASGAGGLSDHDVYGNPVMMGMGKAPKKARKPRAKKAVNTPVKKARKPRAKKVKVGSEMVEANTDILLQVSDQSDPVAGAATGGKKVRAVSKWITHVKAVAKDKGIKYSEALKVASASYKK